MRILYHHRTRGEDAQGIHIRELINAFKQHGHEVTLVALLAGSTTTEKPATPANKAGNSAFNFSLPHWLYELVVLGYNVPAFFVILWQVLRRKHDFIYERYSLFSLSGYFVAKLMRLPFILEVNAPLSLEMKQHESLTFERFAHWLEDWLIQRATHTIVVTAAMRDIFVRRGIAKDKFLIMPNGVDRQHFNRAVNADSVAAKWQLRDRFVVGFVGWIRPWHGVDFLLRAAAQCRATIPELCIFIVGDGPAVPDLKHLTAELDLQQHVVFTGAVDSSAIPSHVAAMDVAVQPDVTAYASPIKLFEYLALGKAIIAPDKANILEVVNDGDTALIYTPGDVAQLAQHITTLYQDTTLRQKLADNAYQLIEQRAYHWLGNAQRVIDAVKVYQHGTTKLVDAD